MAVPDFQSFFKPLLDIAADGKEHSMKEARELIAKRMNIADADLREMLPSGTQTKYDNRIAWAKILAGRAHGDVMHAKYQRHLSCSSNTTK